MESMEESTFNYEVSAALAFALGMILLILSRTLSLIIMISGILMLLAVYAYRIRLVGLNHLSRTKGIVVYRINYIVISMVVMLIGLLLLNFPFKTTIVLAGAAFMISTCMINLLARRYPFFIRYYGFCQIRIILLTLVMLLFYFYSI